MPGSMLLGTWACLDQRAAVPKRYLFGGHAMVGIRTQRDPADASDKSNHALAWSVSGPKLLARYVRREMLSLRHTPPEAFMSGYVRFSKVTK